MGSKRQGIIVAAFLAPGLFGHCSANARDNNALSCLSADERADVLARSMRLDVSRNLQRCAETTGSDTLSFPSGLYRIDHTIKLAPAQRWTGTTDRGNSGSRLAAGPGLNEPLIEFDAAGSIDHMALIGSTRNTPALTQQTCIYIHGTNSVTIRNNFLDGCYKLIKIDQTSFDIVISDNKMYSASGYQLSVECDGASGCDLQMYNNHWLGLTDENKSAMGAARFSGLGSLMWANDGISSASPNGPLVEFVNPAPLYGGVQISNSVFENSSETKQPTFSFRGTKQKAWSTTHIANTFIVGAFGPALELSYVDRLFISNGQISSSDSGGSILIQGKLSHAYFDNVDFEAADGAIMPFHFLRGTTVESVLIRDPVWGGSSPVAPAILGLSISGTGDMRR